MSVKDKKIDIPFKDIKISLEDKIAKIKEQNVPIDDVISEISQEKELYVIATNMIDSLIKDLDAIISMYSKGEHLNISEQISNTSSNIDSYIMKIINIANNILSQGGVRNTFYKKDQEIVFHLKMLSGKLASLDNKIESQKHNNDLFIHFENTLLKYSVLIEKMTTEHDKRVAEYKKRLIASYKENEEMRNALIKAKNIIEKQSVELSLSYEKITNLNKIMYCLIS